MNAELGRFAHLTHILAKDPFVVSSLLNGNTTIVDSRFEDFADQSGLDAIYLINPQGITIALLVAFPSIVLWLPSLA